MNEITFWVMRCEKSFDFLPVTKGGYGKRGFRVGEFIALDNEEETWGPNLPFFIPSKNILNAIQFSTKKEIVDYFNEHYNRWIGHFKCIEVSLTIKE
jgi:hypothetical protein